MIAVPIVLSIAVPVLASAAIVLVAMSRKKARAVPTPDRPDPPPVAPNADGPGARDAWNALHRLALSSPQLEPQILPGHEMVAARVAEAVAASAGQDRYMPRRPLLLPQLLRAVNDTETSRRELAGIIARDPALAADLLRLANSSWYRTSYKPVESIDRAVAVLGTEGIRKLVAAALLQPVFRVQGDQFARFPDTTWDHAFRSAVAAETFAAIVDDSDPFAAQLLALLLGLGAIIVFRMAMDQYRDESLAPAPASIAALIDTHAARAARTVAASWGLSERVLTAIDEQRTDTQADRLTPLGRSVRFGRLTGTLALLRTAGVVTDEAALATLRAAGTPGQQVERIWLRLVPAL